MSLNMYNKLLILSIQTRQSNQNALGGASKRTYSKIITGWLVLDLMVTFYDQPRFFQRYLQQNFKHTM